MRNCRPTLAEFLRETHIAPEMQDHLARTVFNLGGGRMPTVFSTLGLANAINAAESLTTTTPPLNPGIDAALILVVYMWSVAAIGANGTGVVMRLRQGTTLAGAIITNAASQWNATAGSNFTGVMLGIDTPGAVAGMQYSGTVQVQAATANSNTANTFIMAMAIG